MWHIFLVSESYFYNFENSKSHLKGHFPELDWDLGPIAPKILFDASDADIFAPH